MTGILKTEEFSSLDELEDVFVICERLGAVNIEVKVVCLGSMYLDLGLFFRFAYVFASVNDLFIYEIKVIL